MTTATVAPRCDICDREMWGTSGDSYVCRVCDCDRSYRVIRFYQERPGRGRTILDRLTLREAQRHCSDPETSSSTATSATARARTRRMGAWFDGYSNR